jgi:hypothetical protein
VPVGFLELLDGRFRYSIAFTTLTESHAHIAQAATAKMTTQGLGRDAESFGGFRDGEKPLGHAVTAATL